MRPAPPWWVFPLCWLPALAYMAFIFQLSGGALPSGYVSILRVLGDKLAHAGAYAVLAMLYMLALYPHMRGRPLRQRAVLAAVMASAYGAFDEFHQSFIPERSAEVGDWVADTVGAVLGAWLLYWWLQRRGQ